MECVCFCSYCLDTSYLLYTSQFEDNAYKCCNILTLFFLLFHHFNSILDIMTIHFRSDCNDYKAANFTNINFWAYPCQVLYSVSQ